jgi:hypothetical protein
MGMLCLKLFYFIQKLCVFMFSFGVFSQSVMHIPPNNYKLFEPVYELCPTLTGGTISGGIYRQVTLFAGTGSWGATDTPDCLTSNFGIVITKK